MKKQMSIVYTEHELAYGRFREGKRKFKGDVLKANGLSPNRLNNVLRQAKKRYSKEDYDTMGDIAER